MPARLGVVSDKITGIIEPSPGFADKTFTTAGTSGSRAERGPGTHKDDETFLACGPVPRYHPGNFYQTLLRRSRPQSFSCRNHQEEGTEQGSRSQNCSIGTVQRLVPLNERG